MLARLVNKPVSAKIEFADFAQVTRSTIKTINIMIKIDTKLASVILGSALFIAGCKPDDSIGFDGCSYARLGEDSSVVFENFRNDGFSVSVEEGNLMSLHKEDKKLFVGISDSKISSIQIVSGYKFRGVAIPGGKLQDLRKKGINDVVCHNFEDDEDALAIYSKDSSEMIYIAVSTSKQRAKMHISEGDQCYSSYDTTASINFIGIFPQK